MMQRSLQSDVGLPTYEVERLAAECVQRIAAAAVRRAGGSVHAGSGFRIDIEPWAYPLALADGEVEPAGLGDVVDAAQWWPVAHAEWATRPLCTVSPDPLHLVVLNPAHGDWPGCIVAVGEEDGMPVVLAAALLGSDPASTRAATITNLRVRGHAGLADPAPARRPGRSSRLISGPLRPVTLGALALVLGITVVLVPGVPDPAPEAQVTTRIRELAAAEDAGSGVGIPTPGATGTDAGGHPATDAGVAEPQASEPGAVGAGRDILGPGPDNPNVFVPAQFLAAGERGSTPLGQVNIPAVGLLTEFKGGVHEGVLTTGPGHWPGTPLPGQVGNAVLSGHRTTYTAPFRDLDQLVIGQHIGVTVGQGAEVVYQVISSQIVAEADYVAVVTAQPDTLVRQITLFACDPPGQRTHRIVVRAQVAPSSEPGGDPSPPRVPDHEA